MPIGGKKSASSMNFRLDQIYKQLGGQSKAASVAGVTPQQLRKWRDGSTKIPLAAADELCLAAGKTLDWLVHGEARTATSAKDQPAFDEERLADVISALEKVLADDGAEMAPKNKARAVLLFYKHFAGKEGDLESAAKDIVGLSEK